MSFEINEFKQRVETYIGKNKATPSKDIFTFLQTKLSSFASEKSSFLDIGCATGDLLYFLYDLYPNAYFKGVDIEPTLITLAKSKTNAKNIDFEIGEGLTTNVGKFDIVTCFGMLGIFDSFEPLLENLAKNTKQGGRIFVHALLNPDNIDVRIAYKDYVNNLDWMRGFNIFSRQQITQWVEKQGLSVMFHDFQMKSELKKRESQPHRAYTIDLANGLRKTTNGLCLLMPETLMEIYVPK